MTDKIEESTIS